MENMTLAYLHTLFVSVNTAKLCLAELKNQLPTNRQLTTLKMSLDQFERYQKHILPKEDFERLQDTTFDNVALIAEMFPILAMIPPSKIEEFLQKVQNLIESDFLPTKTTE